MQNDLCSLFLHKLPMPYAVHYCEKTADTADDFIFVDVNSCFEDIFRVNKTEIVGQSISQVMPSESEEWNSLYLSLNHEQRRSHNIQIMGSCCHVSVFIMDSAHYATVFHFVDQEGGAERQRSQADAAHKERIDLEVIFDSTQDPLFLIEVNGDEFQYIRNNKAHQRLTGLQLNDIMRKTPVELLGEETGGFHISHFRKSISTRSPVTFYEVLDLPAGAKNWRTQITPVFQNGNITHLVGSRVDISDIVALKQEREQLLRRYQNMFDKHIAIMLIIEPISGRIIDANAAACRFYGYSKKELCLMYINEINTLPNEEVEKYRLDALQKEKKYFLFPHRLKNGEIKLVDVYSYPFYFNNESYLYSIIFDVSDRESYRTELFTEKELLRVTLHSIGDGVVTTDVDGRITGINAMAEEITGWSSSEVIGRPFSDVFILKNEKTGEPVEDIVEKVLRTGTIVGLANHTVLVNKWEVEVPIADSAAPIRDKTGKLYGAIMVFRDVSTEKEHENQIIYLSYHDALTDLFNRRYVEEHLYKLDDPALFPLAVIMGDVNGLKLTNDVFGHLKGDQLLKTVADSIRDNLSDGSIAVRWGGDEFLIFLPQADPSHVKDFIQSIKDTIAERSPDKISISFGFSVKENAMQSIQTVFQEAEERMYHQKLLEGKSFRNTIMNMLLATLYEKSHETEEHALRLKTTCTLIGNELGLSLSELNELSLFAMLHDIGKVGIDHNILKKPGALTPEEWAEMKRHCEMGYRITQNAPDLTVVSEYILYHHERWDGKGYPRGLRHVEIPLLCRILAVADAYDAMVNNRIYRKALSEDEAIQELKQNAGTQFDPHIVDIFISIMSAESG